MLVVIVSMFLWIVSCNLQLAIIIENLSYVLFNQNIVCSFPFKFCRCLNSLVIAKLFCWILNECKMTAKLRDLSQCEFPLAMRQIPKFFPQFEQVRISKIHLSQCPYFNTFFSVQKRFSFFNQFFQNFQRICPSNEDFSSLLSHPSTCPSILL